MGFLSGLIFIYYKRSCNAYLYSSAEPSTGNNAPCKASMVPLAALGILNTYDPESTYYRIAVAKPEGIVVSTVNWILGNST